MPIAILFPSITFLSLSACDHAIWTFRYLPR